MKMDNSEAITEALKDAVKAISIITDGEPLDGDETQAITDEFLLLLDRQNGNTTTYTFHLVDFKGNVIDTTYVDEDKPELALEVFLEDGYTDIELTNISKEV